VAALLGATLLVLIGLSGAGYPRAEELPCRLMGWVRDSCSGKPVRDAYVILLRDTLEGGRGIGRTDSSGWFDGRCACGPGFVKVIDAFHEPRCAAVAPEPARADTLCLAVMPWRRLPERDSPRRTSPYNPNARQKWPPVGNLENDVRAVTHRDSCP
jgi:hypothetical protein